jgi:hypothetical protein
MGEYLDTKLWNIQIEIKRNKNGTYGNVELTNR